MIGGPRLSMEIMGFGIDYTTRQPLVDPQDEHDIYKAIINSMPHETLPGLTATTTSSRVFRLGIERRRYPNLGDPLEVGWKYLIHEDEPNRDEIIDIIKPLAIHRGMKDPDQPLIYNKDLDEYSWWSWLRKFSWSLSFHRRPYYVFIIGGPEEIPFRFQAILDSTSAVGRVHFNTLAELQNYVDKVIRLENSNPVVNREAVFYATDGGITDPTFFSREFMVKPLSNYVENVLKFNTKKLMGDEATKQNFVDILENSKPALVYTASHGLGAPNEDLQTQKRYNGAICTQEMHTTHLPLHDCIYSADDVIPNTNYLEGSLFFEFSCFSYGTPWVSDYDHWLGKSTINSHEDFISALPMELLAHPNGPIGFIGHVDTAWLHGFADPQNPFIIDKWHSRLGPFQHAVNEVLQRSSFGLILNSMNKGFDIGNATITNFYDMCRRTGDMDLLTLEEESFFVENWITRSDAQNYMLFGDPGTYVQV